MRLIVAHPAALPDFENFRGFWAYIDDVPGDYDRVEAAFSGAQPLLNPSQFHRHVADGRGELIGWIDNVLARQGEDGILTSTVNRNPFDEFPLHAFWLRLIAERIDAGVEGDLVVVTRSAGAREALLEHAKQRSVTTICRGRFAFVATWLRGRLRATIKFAFQIATSLVRHAFARIILGDRYKIKIKSTEVLADSYFLSGDVASSGAVNHRYYPGLFEWYRKQGMQAAYLPILFRVGWLQLPAQYLGYLRSRTLFVPSELFTTIADILGAAWQCLRHTRTDPPPLALFGSIDITSLAKHGQYVAAFNQFEALLLGRVPFRLAEAGIRPRLLLDWFENQGYDQTLFAGMRQALPACRVVAMRQYAFMGNDFNLYVTTREVQTGRVPVEHWVCGEYWRTEAAIFDRAGYYRSVPALRYAWLSDLPICEREGTDLLVVLTHSLAESSGLLRCLDGALDGIVGAFKQIRIKSHPAAIPDRLRAYLKGQASRLFVAPEVIWSDAPLLDQMSKARVVVGAGTSATIEAACMGLPVVLIGRRTGFEMQPLRAVDARLWTTVYNGEELARILLAWSPEHPLPMADRRQIAQDTQTALFEPVTEAGMEKFQIE